MTSLYEKENKRDNDSGVDLFVDSISDNEVNPTRAQVAKKFGIRPRFWSALFFFICAYSPLCLIIAVKDFDFETLMWFKHPFTIYILLLISVVSIVLEFISIRALGGQLSILIVSARDRSADLLNYSIPYIVSFMEIDIFNLQGAIMFIILMVLLFSITLKSQVILINPILMLFGYGLYDVDFILHDKKKSGIFISKRELFENCTYMMEKITNYLNIIK